MKSFWKSLVEWLRALRCGEQVAPAAAADITTRVKTGEQSGRMADPLGMRVYHEYFIGDDRGDGHHEWTARVYTCDGLHAEKSGLANGRETARRQADNWGLAVKAKLLESAL